MGGGKRYGRYVLEAATGDQRENASSRRRGTTTVATGGGLVGTPCPPEQGSEVEERPQRLGEQNGELGMRRVGQGMLKSQVE